MAEGRLVGADEALAALGGAGTALLMGPAGARAVRVTAAGAAVGRDGEPVDLSDVFEVCAFDGVREVRWTHGTGGLGCAVMIEEADDEQGPDRLCVTTFLLWGEVTESTAGWSTTVSARVGGLEVPIDAPIGSRLALEVVEYAAEDEHGTSRVVQERTVRIITTEKS
ncbi:type III-D CRISPR-associated protein Csx19 [Cellulomonas bogoriensis]|uniref:Uncharacterized protein n=1 Tax=Cellulomonas bogoriensis 69B4 = DSM 16987 TaxID=1386082 RepID=A0A0A0C2N5_9CELL|nr:CRISPR-associated protein Csx19 [Cellulomonas bogoriensis]KGM14455.1 hypothetical protein N869_11165 [Cellulomonas bogoriensis 69B4 = DSM 16987]